MFMQLALMLQTRLSIDPAYLTKFFNMYRMKRFNCHSVLGVSLLYKYLNVLLKILYDLPTKDGALNLVKVRPSIYFNLF